MAQSNENSPLPWVLGGIALLGTLGGVGYFMKAQSDAAQREAELRQVKADADAKVREAQLLAEIKAAQNRPAPTPTTNTGGTYPVPYVPQQTAPRPSTGGTGLGASIGSFLGTWANQLLGTPFF